MALSRLDSLYMAVVADHSKSPHHHGVLPDVEQLQLNNPTCGDVINLSVKFDGDVIEDIIGKTKAEALELAEIFSLMIQGDHKDEDKLGETKLLAGVSKFPQRIKCATLSWNALKKAIERSEL